MSKAGEVLKRIALTIPPVRRLFNERDSARKELRDLHLERAYLLKALSRSNALDPEKMREAKDLIATRSWYHTFELLPGLVTPGQSEFNARGFLDSFSVPESLAGKSALDIGTWDGPMAFELERRGADVTALDIQDPANTGFQVARSILGSNIPYIRGSVYDLDKLLRQRFDVVTFLGVFYHLKHPILAFEQISSVLKDDGLLLFEGAGYISHSETIDGLPSTLNDRQIASSDVPIALCYPGFAFGASNWFFPNEACLRSWLSAAGLSVVELHKLDEPNRRPVPLQRFSGVATKMPASGITEEHPVVPSNWR
jgi:2-polyprenyl-3-methyl-5-hydroxy-6-metoxy-1,4-benzoquinol methylase